MTTLTETVHAGEFLQSEANGFLSRDAATVASGQVLKAGQVVEFSAGKLIACSGLLDTAGTSLVTDAAGVLFDAVDASAGDVADCVYIAREAEVKDDLITYPTETTAGGEKAAVIASLKSLHIRPR
ncbi:head decoration protein [Mesorhizobium sp.]|uniref:head decoration protein n=1 Tax=Mesorhizobium sp. TaxID=1871066 RepID=UPI000FE8B932|nr:head decoration protein [Mesorhizobium sp.]RWC25899.1 MAG: head decoration protein [Mesorhizobium sp.]TIX27315.1 MAG: head decoration protein [Mesorhizobium sp.]